MKACISTKCIDIGEKIVLFSSNINMLWAINKKTREGEVLGRVPNEPLFARYLFGNIVQKGTSIYLIPLWAHDIWKFDLCTKEWKCIELPENIRKKGSKFFGAIVNQNELLLLGHMMKRIIVLDLLIDTYRIIDVDIDCDENELIKYGFLNWDYCINGESVYTPILCKNSILRIKLSDYSMDEIRIGELGDKFVSIVGVGEKVWVVPRVGRKVILLDDKNKEYNYMLPSDFKEDEMYFGSSFCVSGKVYLCGFKGKTYVFDKEDFYSGEVKDLNIQFASPVEKGYLIQGNEDELCLIDDKQEEFLYSFDSERWLDFLYENQVVNCGKAVYENVVFDTNDYIDYIVRFSSIN